MSCEGFNPEQWVKVYGIDAFGRYKYFATCQAEEVEAALSAIPSHWWIDYFLEPIDEHDIV
ncbi:MAG: hypothetical protein F6K36_18830 [Symploca sp. SIO3C6]|uniref:Uncharacterized protein n=1 Tax=Symploca sp. SIO1C4 TaxID=2607765 RepID=A0A6B3NBN4_9CYAN|nr:hypothetical protein [Symploca sp. SIO3C6]NER26588.1 hypothetical protein [Symploca sp. SIO1C4]NET03165.1 hypothetical protein [Symploca sp. SIO2B6]